MQTQMPLSFFVSHALWKAARSIVTMRVLIPTAVRFVPTASPIEKYGGGGGGTPPAETLGGAGAGPGRFVLPGGVRCGAGGSADAQLRGARAPGRRGAARALC